MMKIIVRQVCDLDFQLRMICLLNHILLSLEWTLNINHLAQLIIICKVLDSE